jgi:hypothetical protein
VPELPPAERELAESFRRMTGRALDGKLEWSEGRSLAQVAELVSRGREKPITKAAVQRLVESFAPEELVEELDKRDGAMPLVP